MASGVFASINCYDFRAPQGADSEKGEICTKDWERNEKKKKKSGAMTVQKQPRDRAGKAGKGIPGGTKGWCSWKATQPHAGILQVAEIWEQLNPFCGEKGILSSPAALKLSVLWCFLGELSLVSVSNQELS